MTIQQVEDELAIRNLVAKLAQLADSGTIEAYLELYADDATWEMPANGQTGAPANRRTGRAEIRAGVEERRAGGGQGPGSNTIHIVTTLGIDLDGDEARGHAYWLFYGDTDAVPAALSMGTYHDVYRRTPTGWRIASRSITVG